MVELRKSAFRKPSTRSRRPCSAQIAISRSFPWRNTKNRHCAAMTQQSENKAKAGAMIVPVTPFEQNCTLIWCYGDPKGRRHRSRRGPSENSGRHQAGQCHGREDLADAWPYRPCRWRSRFARRAQGQDRGSAYRRQIPARQCGGERRAFRHHRRARFCAGSLARRRRSGFDRRIDLRHPALSRPFARQRGVFQQGHALRPCRRCPVQRLGRPHRFARRRSRHPDQIDQGRSCCRSATMSASSAAMAPAPGSATSE